MHYTHITRTKGNSKNEGVYQSDLLTLTLLGNGTTTRSGDEEPKPSFSKPGTRWRFLMGSGETTTRVNTDGFRNGLACRTLELQVQIIRDVSE